MIYRDFQGKRISALGFGTMRLPLKSDSDSDVDEELAAKMFDLAIEGGVNYFDTAWGYHDGQSEVVAGKLLKRYPRERFLPATASPTRVTNCPRIINRKGDGLCPMEKAVLDIDDPLQAKEAILARLAEMKK